MQPVDKEKLISELLTTRQGSEKIASTMGVPLSIGMGYRMALTKLFSPGKPNPSQMLLSKILSVGVELADSEGQRCTRVEKLQNKAMMEMSSSLEDSLFDYLDSIPSSGTASEKLLKEKVVELTVVGEHKSHLPIILMNAITYAGLLKEGLFGQDPECAPFAFKSGIVDTFEGCPLLITRRISSGDLILVARDPKNTHDEIKVNARLTGWGESVVNFEFDAFVSVSSEWPAALKFQITGGSE